MFLNHHLVSLRSTTSSPEATLGTYSLNAAACGGEGGSLTANAVYGLLFMQDN
ncbi:MAG: hypothetical protein RLZZ367_1153 [Bacteroidota bacterium]|jgi:hypothetical protein